MGRLDVSKIKRFDLLIIALVFIALIPAAKVHRLIDFMVFAIFVLSFDLLYGYMGRLSFGHMLYFGTGAYAAALFGQYVSPNPILALLFALVAGVLVGLVLGLVVVRTTGASFALINLAFNEVGFFLAVTAFARYTGGEDGMSASFARLGFIDFGNPQVFFVTALCVLLLVFYVMKRFSASPYGALLRGIKENEVRVRFLGYNTFLLKWVTFSISTGIAALAGALSSANFAYVTTSFIDPQRNVEVIFAALIGGPGTLYGAVIGGTIYMAISNYLASYITRWEMFLGLALLVLVFRFPKGIGGYLAGLTQARHAHGKAERQGM